MRIKKNKSSAGLVMSGVVGMSERLPDVCNICDYFEKILKNLAKKHNLEINASVQVWELK